MYFWNTHSIEFGTIFGLSIYFLLWKRQTHFEDICKPNTATNCWNDWYRIVWDPNRRFDRGCTSEDIPEKGDEPLLLRLRKMVLQREDDRIRRADERVRLDGLENVSDGHWRRHGVAVGDNRVAFGSIPQVNWRLRHKSIQSLDGPNKTPYPEKKRIIRLLRRCWEENPSIRLSEVTSSFFTWKLFSLISSTIVSFCDRL